MERISIDVGLKSYEVADKDGNVLGTVTINPSDVGMAGRVSEAMETIKALTEKAEAVDKSDGFAAAAAIAEIDHAIKDQVDYIFGSKVSEVFFGTVSSLATCENGNSVLENVLNALMPIVEASCKAANENRQKRVSAHTAKYTNRSAGLAPGQRV